MYSDKGRNTKATNIFCANLGAWSLGSHHHNGNVGANLHSFFNNIESVAVPQRSSLLHQGNNIFQNIGVLLVWGKVSHQVSSGNHFLVGSHLESIFHGVLVAGTLFGNGLCTQCIAYIKTGIPQVHSLMETLGTTTDDNNLLAFQGICSVGKFFPIHKAAVTQLNQGFPPRDGIKIINLFHYDSSKNKVMFKFLYCSEKQGFGKGSNEGEGDGLFSVPYATPLLQFPSNEPVTPPHFVNMVKCYMSSKDKPL